MSERYDVAVVGGGPGGYAAAAYGALAGLNIALIEADRIGGTCLNRGCIPTKALLHSAEVVRTVRGAADFGVDVSAHTINWPGVIRRQSQVVDRLVKGLGGLLAKRKVTVIDGFGRLVAPDVLDVDGVRVEADAVILAAGGAPSTIPGFEIDGKRIVTSDQALFLTNLPTGVVIIGAGVIGCELASMFVDFGVEVLVLEALPQALGPVDPDLSSLLVSELTKRGADIRLGATVIGHQPAQRPAAETILFEHNGRKFEADAELIVVAVGRKPATSGIGLDVVGVEISDRGHVQIDTANMRTSVRGIWALGDCVATPALAHVAYAEAMVAIRDILGEDPMPVTYSSVPWCVYTNPEVAWCGLTEEEARKQGRAVEVRKQPYAGVGRAVILGETRGFAKIIADGDTGELLGFHLIGPWATEQLTEGYLATNWQATVDELGFLTHAHPTLGEAIGEAALAMTGRSLHG